MRGESNLKNALDYPVVVLARVRLSYLFHAFLGLDYPVMVLARRISEPFGLSREGCNFLH